MRRLLPPLSAAVLACVLGATACFAHAFLDKAVPAVGATVASGPSELQLAFTEDLVAAFSGVTLATAEGAAVGAGKATLEAAHPAVLHLRLDRALKPGTYVVRWHVVSVDTHRTSGTYRFTVAP